MNGSARHGHPRQKAVHYVNEPAGKQPFQFYDWQSSYAGTSCPLVLDPGVTWTRAGWANEADPRLQCETIVSKYRDRKTSRQILLAGSLVHLEHGGRVSAKSPYEGDTIVNMDTFEHLLDYVFVSLGIHADGSVPHPIAMTETLGNPLTCRSMMSELLFEGYRVPSINYLVDSLASFYQSGRKDGLVVSSSTVSTYVVPVLDGKAALASAKRIAWGGQQAAEYLLKLIQLKYSTFPTRVTNPQATAMLWDHCYYSLDYNEDIHNLANPVKLADTGRIVQFPFTVIEHYETPEDVVLKMQERKREQGRRLQAQANAVRHEKMIQKQADLDAYLEVREYKATDSKPAYMKRVQQAGFRTEAEMNDTIRRFEQSIRRWKNKEAGIDEDEDKEMPSFPLVDIPDHQLTEEQIKDKRKQKLNKAGYDARMRLKVEKEIAKATEAEALRLDDEHRKKDFSSWIAEKRSQHNVAVERIKQRKDNKALLGDRKSLAAQNRMKTIANIASDAALSKKKRKAGEGEDTFGAHDDDWLVYRAIGGEDSEAEEEEQSQLQRIEETLLKHDPDFDLDDTLARQAIAKQKLLNAFIRGMAPDDPLDSFDSTNPEQAAQLHLNVERIRVPEVTFQPSLAGIDSAGLLEVIEHILKSFNPSERNRLTSNVFLTGGYSRVLQFDERIKREMTSVLPIGSPVSIVKAYDPQLDAWRGMAKFTQTGRYKATTVTLADYLENGGEYIKEHELSNAYHIL